MINPEKRTRPLPVGGLEQAVREGRRRRRVALGTGGSGLASVLLAVLLVASLDGSGARSSLELADDPTPTAAPTGSAAPLGPSTAPTASPSAQPSPTADLDCESNDCEEVTEEPDPQVTPFLVEMRPRTRTVQPYVERPVRDGSCESGGLPGSGWCVQTSMFGSVQSGSETVFQHWACSAGSSEILTFTSGQEHELVIERADDGVEVFRFSKTVTYPEGPHQRTIEGGTCLRWDTTWDTGTTAGPFVPAGRYRATVSLAGIGTDPSNDFTDSFEFDVYD